MAVLSSKFIGKGMLREEHNLWRDFDQKKLKDVKAEINELINEYGANAVLSVNLTCDSYSDYQYINYSILVDRKETAEESKTRIAKEKAMEEEIAEREKKQLEILLKKHGKQ